MSKEIYPYHSQYGACPKKSGLGKVGTGILIVGGGVVLLKAAGIVSGIISLLFPMVALGGAGYIGWKYMNRNRRLQ